MFFLVVSWSGMQVLWRLLLHHLRSWKVLCTSTNQQALGVFCCCWIPSQWRLQDCSGDENARGRLSPCLLTLCVCQGLQALSLANACISSEWFLKAILHCFWSRCWLGAEAGKLLFRLMQFLNLRVLGCNSCQVWLWTRLPFGCLKRYKSSGTGYCYIYLRWMEQGTRPKKSLLMYILWNGRVRQTHQERSARCIHIIN